MKYKLYNLLIEKNQFLKKSTKISDQFELLEIENISIEQLLKKKYDVIEFSGSEFELFKPFISVVDWNTDHISTADCLILKNGEYKPYHILAGAIIRLLKKNVQRMNSLLPVIVIGDVHFVISLATKLALSGYIEIIVSIIDSNDKILEDFNKKIKSYVFNLNLKIIPINELTSIEQAGFLLISNFKKEKNKDAYELLTYFNFLSEGATVIDCNSITDVSLVEDARKADIFVIDEVQVLEFKYNYLLELLKNSP